MRCQRFVPKFECKVDQYSKTFNIEVASTQSPVYSETFFLCLLNIVHFAYVRF